MVSEFGGSIMTAAREAMTIRFPIELLHELRATRADDESVNDVVIRAVELEVRRRRGMRAHEAITRRRDRLYREYGLQPDSVPIIRELREERSGGE
jgi:hypothetical protein